MGLGRKGERVANTPYGYCLQVAAASPWGPALPHRLGELPDEPEVRKALQPRRASGLRYSGSNTTAARSASTRPLCRGMPNFVGKSLWIRAITRSVCCSAIRLPLLWGAAPHPLKRFIARSGPSFRKHSTASAARFTAPSMAFFILP